MLLNEYFFNKKVFVRFFSLSKLCVLHNYQKEISERAHFFFLYFYCMHMIYVCKYRRTCYETIIFIRLCVLILNLYLIL